MKRLLLVLLLLPTTLFAQSQDADFRKLLDDEWQWGLREFPTLATVTVLEELAYYSRGLASALYDGQAILVGQTLNRAGGDLRMRYLPALVRGEFVGSFATCAGSTGGGIKMVRMILLVKQARRELVRIIHPRVVNPADIAALAALGSGIPGRRARVAPGPEPRGRRRADARRDAHGGGQPVPQELATGDVRDRRSLWRRREPGLTNRLPQTHPVQVPDRRRLVVQQLVRRCAGQDDRHARVHLGRRSHHRPLEHLRRLRPEPG